MFVMFTDELLVGFEVICFILTGLWYGQEEFGYPALVLPEYCTINICGADISWKLSLFELLHSVMKVSMAAQVINLSALVATREDHCTIFYELLYSVMKEVV
jgi:hypothetical protein